MPLAELADGEAPYFSMILVSKGRRMTPVFVALTPAGLATARRAAAAVGGEVHVLGAWRRSLLPEGEGGRGAAG